MHHWGQTLRLLVELAGTAAFALSGVMEAARKRLDAAVGWLALTACVLVTAGLRGLAIWRSWQLPAWQA